MSEITGNIHDFHTPLVVHEIIGREKANTLQLVDCGLTKDFNNTSQVLLILLGRLMRDEVTPKTISDDIGNIALYREREIYTSNREIFELLEEKIPLLKERIYVLDTFIISLKEDISSLGKEMLVKRLLYIIDQIQDILSGETYALHLARETGKRVSKIIGS